MTDADSNPPAVRIEDPADDRVADFLRLTDVALRRRLDVDRGLYLAESDKVIRRALGAGHHPRALLLTERWLEPMADLRAAMARAGAPVYVATDAVAETMTGFHLHRGAIASMHRPVLPDLPQVVRDARRVVVLEDVVDHTNVGAMFRSAAALGVDAVLVTPRCADPLYRRSVRVSMGTVFQVPWTRIEPWPRGVETLQQLGFTVAALALTPEAITLDELSARGDDRLALVLGAEGDGLAARTLARADLQVVIPMAGGVDSLNVAAAAAVAMWELRVRRA